MGEEKKGGKLRKFFLFAVLSGLIAAAVSFIRRRRGQGFEDNEWTELPPPAGG